LKPSLNPALVSGTQQRRIEKAKEINPANHAQSRESTVIYK